MKISNSISIQDKVGAGQETSVLYTVPVERIAHVSFVWGVNVDVGTPVGTLLVNGLSAPIGAVELAAGDKLAVECAGSDPSGEIGFSLSIGEYSN